MNSGVRKSGGRIVLECLLAVTIAIFTPLIVMSELLMGSMVFALPVIGYVFLKNFAGKPIATLSSLMMLVSSAFLLGPNVMWIMFALNIVPQIVMQVFEKRSFGSRMQAAIITFLLGAVLSVVVMYVSYGGNMIERILGSLPEMTRTYVSQLPEEDAALLLTAAEHLFKTEFTSIEMLMLSVEERLQMLIPMYQMNMPGMLLGGACISAVFSVWLDGWMKFRAGNKEEGVFVPVHQWYLPASTTGGLLLIFGVSLIMFYAKMNGGEAVFMTVFNLAVTAFCVQGFASVRRKFHGRPRKTMGTIMSVLYLWLALVGVAFVSVAPYLAIYGVGSAVFGSGGVIKQRLDARMNASRAEGQSDKEDKNEDEDKGE